MKKLPAPKVRKVKDPMVKIRASRLQHLEMVEASVSQLNESARRNNADYEALRNSYAQVMRARDINAEQLNRAIAEVQQHRKATEALVNREKRDAETIAILVRRADSNHEAADAMAKEIVAVRESKVEVNGAERASDLGDIEIQRGAPQNVRG